MPSNLAIDDALLAQALALGEERTKKDTVNQALREYVARRLRLQAVAQFGTFDFTPGYDYKKARGRRR